MIYKSLKEFDNEVYESIKREEKRQEEHLELIASENNVSYPVLEAAGSVLTNKYAEGYPDARYYGGCQFVDEVEKLAIERVKRLFGAEHANVQPHAGANANLAVYLAVLKPHDTVLAMSLADGGHLTHGAKVSISGKYFNFVHYGINDKGLIDYDDVRQKALEYKPKLIVAGASAYPRKIDFEKFRNIADEVGAYFMVDMAHIAGLVAAGEHISPIPYADFVTTTTHKTLRGPRGAIILCKKKYAKKIDSAVFPGLQGGPLMHIIAAKATAFKEALLPEFKEYQRNVVKNAKLLAEVLMKEGFQLISNGTDNHLMLIDLRNTDFTGIEAEILLGEANITVNKNSIKDDPQPPKVTSGLRIGTPAITTRGLKEDDIKALGKLIADLLIRKRDKLEVQKEVLAICKKYPLYKGE